jgi:hypothetical protein
MNFNLDNATENTISINDSNNGFTKVNISKDNSNYNDINRLNNIELRKPNLGVSNKMDSNIGLDLLMNNNKKKKDNFNSGRPYRQNDNLSNYSDSESNSMSFEGEGSGGGSGLNFRNSGDMNNEEGFDEDDDISGEDEDDETLSNNSDDNKNYKQDYERMMEEKKELLFQFEKLEKKGIRLNKKFTISSNIDEMRAEYETLKRQREMENSVKFQKKMLMAFVTATEFLNSRFDPFDVKLDGWSENMHESINDYDEVMEELHEKYKGKSKMAPELKLLMMVGGSAFMFHLTNTMFKTTLPGMDSILKQNPELARQFAQAAANTMNKGDDTGFGNMMNDMFSGQKSKMPPAPPGFGGGGGGNPLGSMMGNLFGGLNKQQRPPSPQQPSRRNMNGPSNMDDILSSLSADKEDRFDTLSSASESDLSELRSADGINIVRKKNKKKTLVL